MKTHKLPPRQLSQQMQKLDGKLRKAANMYEQQFLRQMVRAMRKSVSHGALTKPNMAENIYREQLDDKYVDKWMDRGGTGFGELIYKDLVNKFFPQLGPKRAKQIRQMNLSDRYQGISQKLTSSKKSEQTFNIQLAAQKNGKSYLKLPWQGTLEKQFNLESGHKVAMFSHPFGLKSTFVFQGQLDPGLLGKTLMDGEDFAQLGLDSQNLTWKIEDANSRKDSSEGKKSSFN